jgi:hypothetical protein
MNKDLIRIAIDILMEEEGDASFCWASNFVNNSIYEEHSGDCPYADPRLVAPVTCSRCVVDELLEKARERKNSMKWS